MEESVEEWKKKSRSGAFVTLKLDDLNEENIEDTKKTNENQTNSTQEEKKLEKKQTDTKSEKELNQPKKLTKVPKELFEKMVDNSNTSVAEYNRQGFKVLLFFTSHLGCPHCQGTMDDILDQRKQLYLLNTIPIVVHNESEKVFEQWSNENERTKKYQKRFYIFKEPKKLKNISN